MENLQVDGINIETNGSSLVFRDSRLGVIIELDKRFLPEIIDFLRSHTETSDQDRLGFRVPLASLSQETRKEFSAIVELADEGIEVTVVDISITGMLVAPIIAGVEIGDKVSIVLSHRGKTATVEALAVRFTESEIALHFPDSLSDGELDPPEALVEVYRALELDWLRERVSTS